MKTRLQDYIDALKASFWALPMLFVVLAIALASLNGWLDSNLPDMLLDLLPPGMDPGDQDSNRAVLTATAGGVLGILGIVFSITITTLVLASQQYGPHLIRTYMQKRFVQIALGVYVGTALYCLLTLYLMAVRGPDAQTPLLGVSLVPVLVTIDLVLLVFFIHRTAVSMQADSIVSQVQQDFQDQVDTLFAVRQGSAPAIDIDPATMLHSITSTSSGYVQGIDREALIKLAHKHDLLIDLLPRVSTYVLRGEVVAHLYPDSTRNGMAVDMERRAQIDRQVRLNLVIGNSPTPAEDPRFAMRQLNQIALRALSPALNDPMTAMSCIDRQTRIVNKILSYPELAPCFVDDDDVVRLRENVDTHADLVAYGFDQIRIAGQSEPIILSHLLDCTRSLAGNEDGSNFADTFQRQFDAIVEHDQGLALTSIDQAQLDQAIENCRNTLRRREVAAS